VVPRTFNRRTLKLPIAGRHKDVGTAKGPRIFSYVVIPSIAVAQISLKDGRLIFRETPLKARNVPTWLATDDEDFIVGMSFLRHFDVNIERRGKIIVRR
jgi:predicted aspartyl protease